MRSARILKSPAGGTVFFFEIVESEFVERLP
jgi:hypothetical protein